MNHATTTTLLPNPSRSSSRTLVRWLAATAISILGLAGLLQAIGAPDAWGAGPTPSRTGTDQRLRQLDRLAARLPPAPAEWLAASARLQIEIEDLTALPSDPESAAGLSQRRRALADLTEQIHDFRTRRTELLGLVSRVQQRSQMLDSEAAARSFPTPAALSAAEQLARDLDRDTRQRRAESALRRELLPQSPLEPERQEPEALQQLRSHLEGSLWDLGAERIWRALFLGAGTLAWWLTDLAAVIHCDRLTHGYRRRLVVGLGCTLGGLGTVLLVSLGLT